MSRVRLLAPLLLLVGCSPEVPDCDVCAGAEVEVLVADPAPTFRLQVCVEDLGCESHRISRDEMVSVAGSRDLARVGVGLDQTSGLGGRAVTVTYSRPGDRRVDTAEIEAMHTGSGECSCYEAWATIRL